MYVHDANILHILEWKLDHVLILISARINNHISWKMCDEINYTFPKWNSFTVEVWEGMRNFISHLRKLVITYDYSYSMIVKWAPELP